MYEVTLLTNVINQSAIFLYNFVFLDFWSTVSDIFDSCHKESTKLDEM